MQRGEFRLELAPRLFHERTPGHVHQTSSRRAPRVRQNAVRGDGMQPDQTKTQILSRTGRGRASRGDDPRNGGVQLKPNSQTGTMRDHESYGTQGEAKRVHAQRTEAYNDPEGETGKGGRGEEGRREGERSEMPNAAERRLALNTSCTSTAGHARGGKQQVLHKPPQQGGRGGRSRSSPRPHSTATRLGAVD